MTRLRRGVQLADAFGLALFVTTGTAVALGTGAPAVTAALVGVITGVGGGVLRDVLLGEIPMAALERPGPPDLIPGPDHRSTRRLHPRGTGSGHPARRASPT